MENMQRKAAQNVYNMICKTLGDNKLKFEADDANMSIMLRVQTEDIPVMLKIEVLVQQQLIRMLSVVPFKFPEEKRIEAAVAAASTNSLLLYGSFDFVYPEGITLFRLVTSFAGSVISPEAIIFMLYSVYNTSDKYNDKLFALANGKITLTQYLTDIGLRSD